MTDRFEDMRALERAIHGVGSATGFWVMRDPDSGRWRRMRYFVDNVTPGTSWEGIYDLWVTEVELALGLNYTQNVSYSQARFLSMVPGDVDNASPLPWGDVRLDEYPDPDDVPYDPATYTVILELEGERYMSEWDANNWAHAERHAVCCLMFGEDYNPKKIYKRIPDFYAGANTFLVGATVKGYGGCFEPESMLYTTHDGQPPS